MNALIMTGMKTLLEFKFAKAAAVGNDGTQAEAEKRNMLKLYFSSTFS